MIFDAVIVALIVISAFLGYKKGFVKTVSKLLSLIISVIVAKISHPFISEFVRNSFIGNFIRNKLVGKTEAVITNDMPYFIQKAGDSTLSEIYDATVSVVTVLLIIIVVFIVVNFIISALDFLTMLPLISWLNRILGFFAGLLMGIILAYLLLAVTAISNVDTVWLEDSYAAYIMFKNNIIMNLIF